MRGLHDVRGWPVRLVACLAGLVGWAQGAPASAEPRAADPSRAIVEDAAPAQPSREQRLEEIRRRIQAALRYPPISRWREDTGAALVRFEIGPERRAERVEVVRSSGVPMLDRAAVRAVLDAGELPFVHGPLELPVRFDLEGSP